MGDKFLLGPQFNFLSLLLFVSTTTLPPFMLGKGLKTKLGLMFEMTEDRLLGTLLGVMLGQD